MMVMVLSLLFQLLVKWISLTPCIDFTDMNFIEAQLKPEQES